MDEMLQELQGIFFAEGEQLLEELESSLMQLETAGYDDELVNKIFRLAHNFKGSSRSVGFTILSDLAHKAEDLLAKIKSKDVIITAAMTSSLLKATDALRKGLLDLKTNRESAPDFGELISELESYIDVNGMSPEPNLDMSQGYGFFDDPMPATSSASTPKKQKIHTTAKAASGAAVLLKQEDEQIRISAVKLDQLLNLVGELVVNQTILQEINARGLGATEKAQQIVTYVSKIVSDVQSVSMSLRLVPVKPLFQKLRRAVRDVATEVAKDIDFVDFGEHVELDKTVLDRMVDPLTHMVRNAVDHGVETPQERIKAGKPALAKVTLTAASHDDHVIITLSDDGKGLNKAKILAKAVERGFVSENDASKMTDSSIHSLIFRPGFSTNEAVTAISGRGVGMEVVQKSIEALKGSIHIDSTEGQGTTFKITLPLSLSIVGGMVVRIQQHYFVVPISQLLETIELSKYRVETSTGKGSMIKLRDEVVPVYSLGSALRLDSGKAQVHGDKRPTLLTSYDGKKVGFEVDDIVGQQQIVLKKLGQEFDRLPGMMGGAVLSSGDPGIVLSNRVWRRG